MPGKVLKIWRRYAPPFSCYSRKTTGRPNCPPPNGARVKSVHLLPWSQSATEWVPPPPPPLPADAVLTFVSCHVDEPCGDARPAQSTLHHRLRVADERDHGPVGGPARIDAQQRHAGRGRDRRRDGVNDLVTQGSAQVRHYPTSHTGYSENTVTIFMSISRSPELNEFQTMHVRKPVE